MPVSETLLNTLRCPETGQSLRIAFDEEIIRSSEEFAEGALITEDGKRLYPIRDGFPVMLCDESVPVCD